MSTAIQLDQAKLESFVGKAVDEFGTIFSSALVIIGDQLGLYRALDNHGPMNASELAACTGTREIYVRQWLVNQAASGVLDYDPVTERYTLPPEQAVALTDESSPFYILGGYQVATSALHAGKHIAEAFRSGDGMLWGEHDHGLFQGTERFFRPGYAANLTTTWIPALDGAEERLASGAVVADVGCGHGASTIILAQAYPNSRFFGFDLHAPSIERAQELAAEAGVSDRVIFEVAAADDFPGADYDLIAYFDSFHDLGSPQQAARHARAVLKEDGWLLLVEPMAGDTVEGNLNPVGRVFSAASVLICTPNGLATSGNGSQPLGALATDAQTREVLTSVGFNRFRRATETPFNRIFEVRP